MKQYLAIGLALIIAACSASNREAVSPVSSSNIVFDVVLKNGRVMDPESNFDAVRNVGITDGVVRAISSEPLSGKEIQDVSGMVVAQGFIDLHAHGQHIEAQRLQVQDGVTTALEMETGGYPIQTFYRKRKGQSVINFGASVSYACLRVQVKYQTVCPDIIDLLAGDEDAIETARKINSSMSARAFEEPLTKDEQVQIRELLDSQLNKGALGVGLAIEYLPGAGRDEIYYAFETASGYSAPVFVHVRRRPLDDAPGVPIAVVQEVIANAAALGTPLQLVHVASTGLYDTHVIVDMIDSAQRQGLDITAEVYPYTAGSNNIGTNMLNDGWRDRFNAEYSDLIWAETGERLTAKTFAKYRRERPEGSVIIDVIPSDATNYAVSHPAIAIASDGMIWWTNKEHPRGAGTFSRVLGKYVREEGRLDLMLALKKMTLMPARRMERFAPVFAKKGRVKLGADADLTVFDPDTVIDRATFTEPQLTSEGIEFVLVRGKFVVKNGQLIENIFPGEVLKNDLINQSTR